MTLKGVQVTLFALRKEKCDRCREGKSGDLQKGHASKLMAIAFGVRDEFYLRNSHRARRDPEQGLE